MNADQNFVFNPRLSAFIGGHKIVWLLSLLPCALLAQPDRIAAPIDARRTVVLKGHIHPLAQPRFDQGPVEPAFRVGYVTLRLKKTDDQLPPMVAGCLGLDDFYPKAPKHPLPANTDGTGAHTLVPDDIATIYDITKLYQAGFDGTGQRIVVVGQSAIDFADIQGFRTKYNLPD